MKGGGEEKGNELRNILISLIGKKSAEDTLQTLKLLMDHGLRELINEPDSLGNTPLHALIVRYALEERRYGYHDDPQPWNKWDMLHIARYQEVMIWIHSSIFHLQGTCYKMAPSQASTKRVTVHWRACSGT